MKTYHILSLDGGGSWAMIQAKCLLNMYGNISGRELLRKFDLVVANSGGSLVLASLAEDYLLSEIVNMFQDEKKRRKAFVELTFWEKSVISRLTKLCLIGPKYSARKKIIGLQELLPRVSQMDLNQLPDEIVATAPGEKKPQFIVCAFDYHRNRAVFFRSDKESKAQTFKIAQKFDATVKSDFNTVTLTQAIHTSSNAPINYFDAPAKIRCKEDEKERYYWDGAVGGYNNPILAGVTEAICNGIKPEDIAILSIGTGNAYLPMPSSVPAQNQHLLHQVSEPSLKEDVLKMTTSILSDPPDAATFMAYTMLYPDLPQKNPYFVRLNPLIQPILRHDSNSQHKQWMLPEGLSGDDFKRLVDLDMDAVAQQDVDLIDKFCMAWFADQVPNQPIRTNGELKCVLGHGSFSEAQQAWLQATALPVVT